MFRGRRYRSKVVELDVDEFFRERQGRPYFIALLATARIFLKEPKTPPDELPFYRYLLSLAKWRMKGKRAAVNYVLQYKRTFNSIKKRGFIPRLGPKIILDAQDGIKDGRRRLAVIHVLGRPKRVKVVVVE